jgi:hypothetical protein
MGPRMRQLGPCGEEFMIQVPDTATGWMGLPKMLELSAERTG